MVKLAIFPSFDTPDKGDGGVRRVVEAQEKYLPDLGFEIVKGTLQEKLDNADIVATHILWPGREADGLQKPVVAHIHGAYWSDYEWHDWAHKANASVLQNIKKADVTTSPSEWVARIFARGMWIKTPVLYSGITPEDWTPSQDRQRQPYVLWNKSRIDPVCEVDTLAVLARMANDTNFVSTFGPPNPLPNITLTGKRAFADAKEYVQNAAVYLCNARETFGIGTLEAMACEVPILGWDWGGQREIVEHKTHGWLATPGDFEGLHEGLKYCMQHRDRLGKAAREHVLKNFTWERSMQECAKLYKQTLTDYNKKLSGPKVSVIITCYNLAEYLPRAVKSVQAQGFTDWEIIIVNDASPDNTSEVAANLSKEDKRVRVITNESNLYLARALNRGIAAALGQYIVPLDADNELGKDALKLMSEPLDADRGIHITYGGMELVKEDGSRSIGSWPPPVFDYFAQMRHRNQITSTAMFRKEIWERVGGYRGRCKTAEDADFWCRATSYGAVPRKVTDAATLIYYDRHDSMSHTQRDWPWEAWYPWHQEGKPQPFGAALPPTYQVEIPTYEPPRVTVVIPVGPGHELLVVDALDSVAAQTYKKWDCVVVNDSGGEIPWLPAWVKVIKTGGKKGPALARNLAIVQSKTPLWLPLDADDILLPTALENLVAEWEPGYYIYGDTIVHETGELKTTPEFDCVALTRRLIHPVTALYEKQSWLKAGGFDTSLKGWEDWDFVLAIVEKGTCGRHISVPIFQYRMHSGSRREEAYANRESNKEEIIAKWHKYIVEGVALMAGCGGCGGSKKVAAPQVVGTAQVNGKSNGVASPALPEAELVEFIGNGAARTFTNPKTGNSYRFGSDAGHKKHYVRQVDMYLFRDRPDEFRVADTKLVESGSLQAV